jgi:hypothetical protein
VCQCNNAYFETVTTYKLLPALCSPSGQDQLISIPMAKCTECSSIYTLEEMLKKMKDESPVELPDSVKKYTGPILVKR